MFTLFIFNSYVALNDFNKAFHVSFEGLRLAESLQSVPGQTIFYQGIGDMYWLRKTPQRAIMVYKQGLKKVEGKIPENQLRGYYFGLANCFVMQEQFDSAAYYFQKNYKSVKADGDTWGIAAALSAFGNMYQDQKKYHKSIQYYEQSVPYYQSCPTHQRWTGLVQAYDNLANLRCRVGQLSRALSDAKKATIFADSSQLINLQKMTYGSLASIYEQNGKSLEALKTYKSYVTFLQKEQQSEKEKIAQETTAKYEIYEKDKEINKQKLSILEEQRRKVQIIFLGICVIALMGVGWLLYRRRQKRKLIQLQDDFVYTYNLLNAFNESVSHDLRQPLINARNAFEKIKWDSIENKTQMLVLKRSIGEAEEIIDAMLTLSKVDKKELSLKYTPTEELVKDVLSSISYHPKTKILFSPLPPIYGDTLLIRQVFNNLLSNAIKFSARSPTPIVSIEATINDGHTVFIIRDNGVGFTQTQHQRLFQPFTRFNEGYDGIGLGLVIVQRIIERHNGYIWAESTPMNGAAFLFYVAEPTKAVQANSVL